MYYSFYRTISLIFASLLLLSCKGPSLFDRLQVSPSHITVEKDGGEYIVTSEPFGAVSISYGNGKYLMTDFYGHGTEGNYSLTGDWISAYFVSEEGEFPTEVHIIVKQNTTDYPREATVTLHTRDKTGDVKVIQQSL